DHISKQYKPLNSHHEHELSSFKKIRVRPLFFKKFRFAMTFSRFKARHMSINLGDKVLDCLGFEHGEGELFSMLSRYDTSDYHVVRNYDVTVYFNDENLGMRFRLKYEAIITNYVFVKTKGEYISLMH